MSNVDPLIVATPLGHMRFNCSFNGKSLANIKPKTSFLLNPNSILSSWAFEECNIEFVRVKFPPQLPQGMHVDHCFAGIWKIKTLGDALSFKLSGYLESQIKPDVVSDEYLIAQSFEDSSNTLMIGTEDEEALISRAINQKLLPLHFKDSLTSDNVHYASQGLEIILPESKRDDLIQIHFIVAWTSKLCNPMSTEFAVDQSSEYILSFLNKQKK